MSMGTIKVMTPEGEEKEVELSELLTERRRRQAGDPTAFQVKILWGAAASGIGLLISAVIFLVSSQINDLKSKVEQLDATVKSMQINSAQSQASTDVKYTQIIRDLSEIKQDLKAHLDQGRGTR